MANLFSKETLQKNTKVTTKVENGLLKPVWKDNAFKAVVRFLPNIVSVTDEATGQTTLEMHDNIMKKISFYVDKEVSPQLAGNYDSPRNFNPKADCKFSKLRTILYNHKSEVMKSKMDLVKNNTHLYSYVLVIDCKQAPELVGKVMIFQFNKTINDMIEKEMKADGNFSPFSPFSDEVNPESYGKNFIIDLTYNDKNVVKYEYKACRFSENITACPLVKDGVITKKTFDGSEAHQQIIVDLVLNAEHKLSQFEPKVLTPEQEKNIDAVVSIILDEKSNPLSLKTVKSDDFLSEEDTPTTSSKTGAKADFDDFDDFDEDDAPKTSKAPKADSEETDW